MKCGVGHYLYILLTNTEIGALCLKHIVRSHNSSYGT